MVKVEAASMGRFVIGRRGENHANTVMIHVDAILKRRPEARLVLLVQRPGECQPYIASTTVVDGWLLWHVSESDTAIEGTGKAEVQARVGTDVVEKSPSGTTVVLPALGCASTSTCGCGCGETAAPKDWVKEMLAAADAAQLHAEDAAEKAKEAADSAQDAADAADRAEQGALKNGFAVMDIDESGHLILTRTENLVDDLDFEIINNKNLEVAIGG